MSKRKWLKGFWVGYILQQITYLVQQISDLFLFFLMDYSSVATDLTGDLVVKSVMRKSFDDFRKILREQKLDSYFRKSCFGKYLDLPENNNARFQMKMIYDLLKRRFMYENKDKMDEVWINYCGMPVYFDFATSRKCSACKCQDCKANHNEVINAINALTASVKEMTSKRGVIPTKRISYPDTPLEIKCARSTGEQHELKKVNVIVEATAEEHNITVDNPSITSKEVEKWSLDCGPLVAAYTEYLSDGLLVPNDGLDARLLRKKYAALLWKYGETKPQKPYTSDIKDPR
ncbi:putative protein EIN4-like [Capsicum annuum]|nr:putative protein EIN4-like [Capsicum annuum]KAF3648144.1 putative protein EIN4-like [Capsicum annuum]